MPPTSPSCPAQVFSTSPPDRAPVLGDDTSEPDAVTVSDFANRVGDPVGILTDDGSTYSGEDLVLPP